MRNLVVGMTLALVASRAQAAPVSDTADWAQRFTETALKSDPAAIVAQAKEVADPRLDVDALRGALDKVGVIVGPEPGEYAEQFDQNNVGSFMRRINVAVKYPKTFIFYNMIFVRGSAGWQMVQFNYNTNLNEVMRLGWPE